jgi:hypothetical protein
MRRVKLLGFLFMLSTVATPSWSQNATTPGKFTVELPTLLSLGFEWKISGDDNRNAQVDVTYRKKGDQQWQKALPFVRMDHERIPGPNPTGPRPLPRDGGTPYYSMGAVPYYEVSNMFAGSILNLEADTEYECHFVLSDPDGVKGKAVETVTVRTRKEPEPAVGGQVYHVYPFGYKGTMQQPGFIGLLAAYNLGADESDHYNVLLPRVKPGDIILVHAGLYKDDSRFVYSGFDHSIAAYGTPFDGTYYLTASGTPDKPIVIKAAGDGEVIFDGLGCQNLFNMLAANYNYFEGITVRNTNVAFLLGLKRIAGASGFTLKHSRVYDVGRVVQDEWSGSKDFYIADNVFIGRHNPTKETSWTHAEVFGKFPGFPAPTTSEYAIKVYGQGHVVAYNYAANWHDGIDVATYGDPDGTPDELADRVPVSIDFYGNDFYNEADNCIEADGGAHNIRVFRNRCFNASGGALSAQPVFGGPVYFYRNLVYNDLSGPLKLADDGPIGVLIYQNTFIGENHMAQSSNVHVLNNLVLGDGWSVGVSDMNTHTNYSSSDYNGFRPNPGDAWSFGWESPASGVAMDYTNRPVTRHFSTLKEYGDATGEDKHSVLIDYDSFVKVPQLDKSDPQRLYNPEDYDFRLKPDSPAVDAGTVLPTITDDFAGKAPDLGAYEVGKPLPHYGPRTWPVGTPEGAPRSVTGPPAGSDSGQ